MPANLENSAVATGLEKVNVHSNPKARQCQRMFKLPHNCTHLTRQQSNAQNSPSQASTVCEPRISRFQAGFRKGRGPEIKLPTSAGSSKKQESSRKTSTSALLTYAKAFDSVDHNKLWKILQVYQRRESRQINQFSSFMINRTISNLR